MTSTSERIRQVLPDAEATWWSVYERSLAALTPTARRVLDLDCSYIIDRGVLAAGPPGDARWPASRVRRGMVMGSVQSGKTASLLGVAAMAMDRGVDVVLVLGGTRLSLWRQTIERTTAALAKHGETHLKWVFRPGLIDPHEGSADISALYRTNVSQAGRALQNTRPLVYVAMKQVDHLRALGETLSKDVVEAAARLNRPIHLLVLDDEADDGSVLDARAEAGLDPTMAHLKQIPRQIVDLWASRSDASATRSELLSVTYVGYTATPQANFLQSLQNPLAPTDFVAALRTPLDVGGLDPREPTYTETSGPRKYYSGGELFYRRLEAAGLCPPVLATPNASADDLLAEALRCYLVAGAVRRLSKQQKRPALGETTPVFSSRAEAENATPDAHSMLVHPAASIDSHFEVAARVMAWFGGLSLANARARIDAGRWELSLEGVLRDLKTNEERWSAWLADFRRSTQAVTLALAWPGSSPLPSWSDVATTLERDVLAEVRLSVVNSDARSDDRPRFSAYESDDGWHMARDTCTIFVSGNVMARGLTLEGLTTSVFLRSASDPYADTQMQMQRWFGYRGEYLSLCRVFLPPRQLSLFSAYHDTDEALRRDVIAAMNRDEAVTPHVLQGEGFLATGKIANLANQPLFPGLDPVVQLMSDSRVEDENLGLVVDLFAGSSRAVGAEASPRGRLLTSQLSLLEVAQLLERLRYGSYEPGNGGWVGAHWSAVERQIGIGAQDPHHPLYRPPGGDGPDQSLARGACPYATAAYFRLWDACLRRHARGLFPTDQPDVQWSLIDLDQKRAQAPSFSVGLRFGRGEPVVGGVLDSLSFPVRPMARDVKGGYLQATWGARAPAQDGEYHGDQSFDLSPGASGGRQRPPGSPGLVLLQVVERPEGHPTLAVGLVIPLGGPDHFAARVEAV